MSSAEAEPGAQGNKDRSHSSIDGAGASAPLERAAHASGEVRIGRQPRPRPPQLHRDYLHPDEMLLALPRGHPAAQGDRSVPLESLAHDAWATIRAGTVYSDMFLRICRSVGGFEPNIRHRANDLQLLLDLFACGCCAVVPALGAPERDSRVAVRRIAGGSVSRAIFVAIRDSDRARPSTAAVVAALQEMSAYGARRNLWRT